MSKHTLESLTLPGTLASLSSIGNYVMKVATSAGIDKSAAYRLRLAVDEIATNCVVHGYDEGGLEGMLYLGGSIDDDTLTAFLQRLGAADAAWDSDAIPAGIHGKSRARYG